jgi:hypothetical protein
MSIPGERQFRSGKRAFLQHGMAIAKKLGRAPPRFALRLASFLNEFLLFDEPSEVLLVKRQAG